MVHNQRLAQKCTLPMPIYLHHKYTLVHKLTLVTYNEEFQVLYKFYLISPTNNNNIFKYFIYIFINFFYIFINFMYIFINFIYINKFYLFFKIFFF